MKFEYLIFNLLIFLAPTMSGYFYKKTIWPKLKPLIKSFLLVSVPFIIHDQLVTDWFWKFNPKYTSGFHIGSLPFEEILFFAVIPFSCLFLWVNLKKRLPEKAIIYSHTLLYIGILALLLSVFSFTSDKIYTGQVLLALGFLSIIFRKNNLIRKKGFIAFIGIVIVLTFAFNGYLTARPVVIYNPAIKTNFNILTIPIEDFIYSLILVGTTILIYEKTSENISRLFYQ